MPSPLHAPLRPALTVAAIVSALAISLILSLALTPTATAATSAQVATSAQADEPAGSPGVDFPVLPRRCYDPYKPAPTFRCPILRAGRDRPTMVLWGDSHAWQYVPAVRSEAKKRRLNLVLFMAGGCPPTLRPELEGRPFPACDASNRAAYDFVTRLRDRNREVSVLLGSYWSFYRIGYRKLQNGVRNTDYLESLFVLQHTSTKRLFERLAAQRIPFDLIGQTATVPDTAPDCAAGNLPYACTLPRRVALPREADTRRWLQRLTDSAPGPQRYVATWKSHCGPAKCRASVADTPVYYDQFHFGADFAATLGSYFTGPLDRLARRAGR